MFIHLAVGSFLMEYNTTDSGVSFYLSPVIRFLITFLDIGQFSQIKICTKETCYFLEGDVVVTPDGGEPVEVGVGDLVTFPEGMSCTWEVRVAVRKHYKFED